MQQFPFHKNPPFSTLMAIPRAMPWKMVEKSTLKSGSSPPEQRKKFRQLQFALRALPIDRKTEAELVLRDQTKRRPVETFTPEEFETFLGVV